jgi:hypothetical protein
MKTTLLLAVAVASLTCAATAQAADPHPFTPDAPGARPAEIAFADLGGIDDWRVSKDGALLIRSTGGRYFRATFFGSCPELPFAERVGFVTEADGSLDRWSSIYADGDRCYFRTFDATDKATFDAAR